MLFTDPTALNEQIKLVNAAIAKEIVSNESTDEEYLSILMDARNIMQRFVAFEKSSGKPRDALNGLMHHKVPQSIYVNIDTFKHVETVGDLVYGISNGERVVVDTKHQVFCHMLECDSVIGVGDHCWFSIKELRDWRRLNEGQQLQVQQTSPSSPVITIQGDAVVKVISDGNKNLVMVQWAHANYYGTVVEAPFLEISHAPVVAD